MSEITQTIKMPETGPTADQIVDAALATAQDAMEVLGPSADPLTRALALVGLGHSVWFAEQTDRQYRLVGEGGKTVALAARPTKSLDRLRSLPKGNTVVFDIELPNAPPYRCVYDRQRRRCGPLVDHQEAVVVGSAR